MSKIDWNDKVLIDTYEECSPVGLSYEELYQAFKARYEKEVGIEADDFLTEYTNAIDKALESIE